MINSIYAELIQDYIDLGFSPIPIPFRAKNPIVKGWTKLRITKDQIDTFFPEEETNIGIVLGKASNGLVDVDVDDPDALRFSSWFLPPTNCVFGRASKPRSHWVYRVPDSGGRIAFECSGMIVELRGNGCCTVFPGSTHPSGEFIEFVNPEDYCPSPSTWAELKQAATKIAIATVLYEHWTDTSHSRHDLALAVSAFLVRRGWSRDDVSTLIEAVATEANDIEVGDRLTAVDTTFEAHAQGQPISGNERLQELLGKEAADKMASWTSPGPSREKSKPEAAQRGEDNQTDITNDAGAADAFADAFREELKYARGQWFRKSHQIFEPVSDEIVQGIAKAFFQGEVRKLVSGHMGFSPTKTCLSRARINAAVDLSRASFQLNPNSIDSDINVVGCADGTVLELATSGSHQAVVTKRLGANLVPDAVHPRWEEFLRQVFNEDEDVIGFVRRAVGYCLTGSVAEQCFFILIGTGANGKSTFLKTLHSLFGDYAGSVPMSILMEQRCGSEQTNDLAYLVGKRFVAASEGERGQKLAESKIKKMTGGDHIVCRHLYKDYFEFNPHFKLWLATNELPSIAGMDDAIWRRVKVIEFPVKFSGEQDDKHLGDRLTTELPGILNWAIRGYEEWKRQGLNPPLQVLRSTGEYRNENGTVAQWIESECIVAADARATMKELYQSYRAWCETSGLQPVPSSSLGKDLERRKFPSVKGRNGNARLGIGLLQEPNRQLNPFFVHQKGREHFEKPLDPTLTH